MDIREAVETILGERVARGITANQGLYWAVVAAMMKARMTDDQRAITAIREWNAERQRAAEGERTP